MPDRPTIAGGYIQPINPRAGWRSPWATTSTTGTNSAICPDLLSIKDLGEADSWRGHLVRGVFKLLRLITGV